MRTSPRAPRAADRVSTCASVSLARLAFPWGSHGHGVRADLRRIRLLLVLLVCLPCMSSRPCRSQPNRQPVRARVEARPQSARVGWMHGVALAWAVPLGVARSPPPSHQRRLMGLPQLLQLVHRGHGDKHVLIRRVDLGRRCDCVPARGQSGQWLDRRTCVGWLAARDSATWHLQRRRCPID